MKCVRRYVRNNHADGRRADAAAVISGAHVPRRGAPSPFPSGLVADVTARVRRLPSMQVRGVRSLFTSFTAARGTASLFFGFGYALRGASAPGRTGC